MKTIITLLSIAFCITCFGQTQIICPGNGQPCYTVPLTSEQIAQQQALAVQYQQQVTADSIGNANTQIALNHFLALANSAVGVRADSLSNQQELALFGLVLFKAGAIDSAGYKIKPLNSWVH